MDKSILEASKEFKEDEVFVVTRFSEGGGDFDEEYVGFTATLKGLDKWMAHYEAMDGASSTNLMSTPYLSHPDGNGSIWDTDTSQWS